MKYSPLVVNCIVYCTLCLFCLEQTVAYVHISANKTFTSASKEIKKVLVDGKNVSTVSEYNSSTISHANKRSSKYNFRFMHFKDFSSPSSSSSSSPKRKEIGLPVDESKENFSTKYEIQKSVKALGIDNKISRKRRILERNTTLKKRKKRADRGILADNHSMTHEKELSSGKMNIEFTPRSRTEGNNKTIRFTRPKSKKLTQRQPGDLAMNGHQDLEEDENKSKPRRVKRLFPWVSDAYLRPVRSTNERKSTKWDKGKILPGNCSLSQTCSLRDSLNEMVNPLIRFPCRCDENCQIYGDCCHDFVSSVGRASLESNKDVNEYLKDEEGTKKGERPYSEEAMEDNERERKRTPLSVSQESWTCRYLPPEAPQFPGPLKAVYMVSNCPKRTRKYLADKCQRISEDEDSQGYLLDIPVVSLKTNVVYSNVFCAQCHNDSDLKGYKVTVSCDGYLESWQELADMAYHRGELMWSAKNSSARNMLSEEVPTTLDALLPNDQESGVNSCILGVIYDDEAGRSCEEGLIDTCEEGWVRKDIRRRCSSYNYYVKVEKKIYKNWHCAVCNRELESDINCLPNYHIHLRFNPPSLSDLFKTEGQCEEDQIWNFLYDRCEDVSCGYLYTLIEGECVRNNKTIDGDQSFLNSSCYTYEFHREYSVTFPNRSIYLNHTMGTYNFGEYEYVNRTWIKICRPKDRWTPVMNIISTILISISLLCMVIHMALFISLPKRRNIPSKNLFSMTFSLFITELIFVTFFYHKENYAFCVVVGVTIYYFLSASFMWMNVMSIDICRTFHSKTYKTKSRKVFIHYSIYAWSVPLISTTAALLIDQFASDDFILSPEFGTDRCWFNQKWGLVTFFTLPSGLIVLMNLGLYGVSVFDIYKQHKSGELASSTVRKSGSKRRDEKEIERCLKPTPPHLDPKGTTDGSSDSDSPGSSERFRDRLQRRIHANKKQRVRLVLYCKLALIMGLTWIFAFISFHTESLIFEYLFIVFNGLQGTFIFIAFDCKQKLWDELWLKLTGKRILRKKTEVSSQAKETTLSSSDGHYKYRWSSNRNQE